MKNKFITKIIGATLAFALMIGGAVGINAAKQAKEVNAAISSGEESGLAVLTNSNFDTAAEYVLKSTDGYYWNGVSGTSSSKWGGITKTLAQVARVTIDGTWADGFTIKDSSNNYLRATTGNMTWATTSPGTFKMGVTNSGNYPIVVNGTSNGLKVNGTSGIRLYTNLDYNASTGKAVALYKIPGNKAVTGVTVSPTSVTLGVGATQQLTPTVSPNDATNTNVSYSSGNTGIATVSASGLVTAVAAGDTTITVTTQDGGFTATCQVTVTAPVNVTGVTLNKNSTTIAAGSTETLTATVAPNDASNKSVNWSSSNENVAIVDAGVVTAVAGGVATITATTVDGGFTATCEVTVTIPSSVTFASASNTTSEKTITIDGITMTSSNGLLSDAAGYRFYSGSTLTFTSTIGKMRSIEFTGSDASKKISRISTTVNTGTVTVDAIANTASWSGNANSVTFSLEDQGRANEIVVTMAPTVPTVVLDKESIELKTNDLNGKQVTATTYNVANPHFIWTPASGNKVTVQVDSTDENVQTVTIKPNTNDAVDTSVIVTIENTSISATLQVHITEPGPGESPETAYSVSDAKNAIAAADADIPNVYITGIVSKVDSVNLTTHKATYWISDDGTTANQFRIYCGKNVNNTDFTSDSQIVIGDEVVVYGVISKQHGSLNEDNYIVSITLTPRVNSIALTPTAVTVDINSSGNVVDLFTSITINQDDGSNKTSNDIVWTSDDEDVFCIVNGTEYLTAEAHRMSTTIHASIGGREFATATVNVFNSNAHAMSYDLPEEWREVTDPSTLIAGDKVVFTGVKDNKVYAAGTYSAGNNVKADSEHILTESNGVVTGVQSTMIYTLVSGSKPGTLAFKDSANKYLYAASDSENHMKTQDEVDDNASFVLNSNGTVVAQGTNSHNQMKYNQSNNLFSCYVSGQTNVKFYKLSTGTAELDLFNLNSISEAHEDENSAYIRLGASLSEEDWAAMDSAFGIAGYGVMLIRETTLESTTFDTIAELYNSNDTENKAKLSNLGKNSETAPQDFSVAAKINIKNESDRNVAFCAAVYVKARSGAIYFINETRGSLVGLL